jgi:hypothetical protein
MQSDPTTQSANLAICGKKKITSQPLQILPADKNYQYEEGTTLSEE